MGHSEGGRSAPLLGNRIDGAYGIVETSALPGVPILAENRLAGHSNAGGRLLLPRLRPFQLNRIAIDPLALPDLALAGEDRAEIRPGGTGAFRIGFRIDMQRPYLVTLVDDTGDPLPPGTMVETEGQDDADAEMLVGYGGALFLPDGSHALTLMARRPDGRACSIAIHIPADLPPLSDAGRFTCARLTVASNAHDGARP
ncbi:MAG: FimD/PapC C-terminal domain-containing protein [Blastomonas sp.]